MKTWSSLHKTATSPVPVAGSNLLNWAWIRKTSFYILLPFTMLPFLLTAAEMLQSGTAQADVKDLQPQKANHGCDFNREIQSVAEQTLNETVGEFQAVGGWVIVQEVKTGKILAMASHSNEFNNAVNSVYEPGSIMKAITLAAAMNEKLVTPDTVMDAGNGAWVYEGKTLRDYVIGTVTVRTALQKSSNIVFAKIGLMLGNIRLDAYARAFGFGRKLGCGLPDEQNGILAAAKDWDNLKTSRVPVGQGIAVTALQMVNAYSCIANGGTLMRPYFTDDGKPEIIGRPITTKIASELRSLLGNVTEQGGTGLRASLKGYSVAGKTGTAQKAIKGGYSETDFYASFVGFVPADNPVFCVIVTIDSPKPEHAGGYVAAPAFSKIAGAAARILNLPTEKGR